MAYATAPHKSLIEVHSLHRLSSFSNRADVHSNTGAAVPSSVCYRRIKCVVHQTETNGARATPSLWRRGQQTSVCLDRRGEGSDEQEMKSDGTI
ncbi:hypothetical protein OROMI_013610 [Orobanche minor]